MALALQLAGAKYALAEQSAADPWRTDELKVVLNSDILSTNPGVRRDSRTDVVMAHVVESLVGLREDLSIAPQLAESYKVSEDGTVYTFRLRSGATFHNGEPVRSVDVKWTWDRFLDRKTGWRCRSLFDGSARVGGRQRGVKILSIQSPDPMSVVFRLDRPSAVFLHHMGSLQCGAGILHSSSLDAEGEWREPVGTGPFKLKTWRRGQYVILERHEGYEARPEEPDGFAGSKYPYARYLRFIVIPDPASALVALYSGDVDIYPGLPHTAYRDAERRPDVTVSSVVSLVRAVLLIQTDDPLLSDVRVRKAIAHAINTPVVAEIATSGLAIANPSVVQTVSPYWNESHGEWLPHDLNKARRLLEEAGYSGEPITIQTNRKFAFMYRNSVAIQAMLHNAGINARLEVMDWAAQLANYMEGRFQLSTMQFSARSDPALGYGIIVGDKERKPWRQWGDPVAARLVDRSEIVTDETERGEIFNRLHAMMKEDVPILELYNFNFNIAVRQEVHGIRNWSIGAPLLWNVWKEQ